MLEKVETKQTELSRLTEYTDKTEYTEVSQKLICHKKCNETKI